MISTHFSTTSYISSVINKLHENTHKNRIIHFTQKEILTRVTAVSLPIFALLDCIVHTAGILECGVKSCHFIRIRRTRKKRMEQPA